MAATKFCPKAAATRFFPNPRVPLLSLLGMVHDRKGIRSTEQLASIKALAPLATCRSSSRAFSNSNQERKRPNRVCSACIDRFLARDRFRELRPERFAQTGFARPSRDYLFW